MAGGVGYFGSLRETAKTPIVIVLNSDNGGFRVIQVSQLFGRKLFSSFEPVNTHGAAFE